MKYIIHNIFKPFVHKYKLFIFSNISLLMALISFAFTSCTDYRLYQFFINENRTKKIKSFKNKSTMYVTETISLLHNMHLIAQNANIAKLITETIIVTQNLFWKIISQNKKKYY